MKPHVICHMMSPLDGRLKVAEWTPGSGDTFQKFVDEYERIHTELGADAWIAGRATGEEFADGEADPAEAVSLTVERPVHVAIDKADEYAVILDTHGSLKWTKPEVNGAHLIVVFGSTISDDRLAQIADAGISYIVSSGEHIDVAQVLEVLGDKFNIRTILLEGGATNNGSFMKAKLVDEVSYVLFPAIGGISESPAIFEAGEEGLADLVRLHLKSFEQVGCEALHVRYSVSYTD